MKQKIIAVDFDGTCVAHAFPNIGMDIGAVPVLQALANCGHKLILWTMRSGRYLDAAVDWCVKNNIPLHAINDNPSQTEWTQSRKVYANFYIDDAAIGTPLLVPSIEISDRGFVDWAKMKILLIEKGLL